MAHVPIRNIPQEHILPLKEALDSKINFSCRKEKSFVYFLLSLRPKNLTFILQATEINKTKLTF